jgi:superfamily II DNA or RNA helicase
MSEPRAFSPLQRVEIFNRSNGNCQRCGVDITLSNFHADHIIPWSQNGKTQVSNGQALCPPCNLKKSGTMDLNYKIHLPPHLTPARAWQDDFLKRFFASALRQLTTTPSEINPFILHAFPASGKSLAQCLAAKTLIDEGYIDQVVILVPSGTLKDQMIEDGRDCGLKLNSKLDSVGCHGIVTTYQTLAQKERNTGNRANAEWLRRWSDGKRTMVVADEVHHLGEKDKSWTESFLLAFHQSAVVRLITSGTLFRSDGAKLPWARYDKKTLDLSPPHAYSYGYGTTKWNQKLSALGDECVRDVEIIPWDGEVKFKIEHYIKGELDEVTEHCHRISDNIDQLYPDVLGTDNDGNLVKLVDNKKIRDKVKSKRRLAAIECGSVDHPHGTDYVRDQLIAANEKLRQIRQVHTWASGLIVCKDIPHANNMAKALKHWTGEEAEVVTSETKNATKVIRTFAEDKTQSRKKWIIAVAKISEGVTIKHLRVGVFMTNIQSPMRWTQILGRVLRTEPELPWDHQTAAFYQYDDGLETVKDDDGDLTAEDANIRLYAKSLLSERDLAMDAKTPKKKKRIEGGDGSTGGNFSVVRAESATGSNDHTIYGGERHENEDLRKYEKVAIRLNWTPVKVKQIHEQGGFDNWQEIVHDSD